MTKPEYKCELIEIRETHYPGMRIAAIRRLEYHKVLGPPPTEGRTITHTSVIVKHDVKARRIETQHSIYTY